MFMYFWHVSKLDELSRMIANKMATPILVVVSIRLICLIAIVALISKLIKPSISKKNNLSMLNIASLAIGLVLGGVYIAILPSQTKNNHEQEQSSENKTNNYYYDYPKK